MLGRQRYVDVFGDICRKRFKKSCSMMHATALKGAPSDSYSSLQAPIPEKHPACPTQHDLANLSASFNPSEPATKGATFPETKLLR